MTSENELKLLLKALAFAAHKHRDQRRKNKGASPYINHPISIADILCNEAHVTDMNIICAALLHDTVEDTQTTEDELILEFGLDITGIVMEVTDDRSKTKQVRKQLQVEHAAHISPEAQIIKLADKISNLRDIANDPPKGWSLERKREYFDWAKRVIDEVRGVHPGLEAMFDEVYARRE